MAKTHTVYDNMVFPDYSYMEYPAHVYVDSPDGSYEKRKSDKFVVVNSDAERDEALNTGKVVREPDERERLLKVAEIKGVKHDKRWGADKLRDAIEDAGFDAEHNPYE